MKITTEKWQRSKELFQAALELDPPLRSSFLDEHCQDDDLRQHVEELLISYEEAGKFLDDPALNPSLIERPNATPLAQTDETSGLHPVSGDPLSTAINSEAHDPVIGRRLGPYKIVKRIGQGGMAVVYLALRADDEYSKQVAIKLVASPLDTGEMLRRFRNERQTLAGLDHPNIVKLLDGGSAPDGLSFMVMDYVEGCPIDEYCDLHKLRIDDRLRLFCKVCEAVQYAHEKSIVHRDLKPSNILVTDDGTPRLLDFGIAKVLDAERSPGSLQLTQTGIRCMTPAYASPEQMRGEAVTTASDIYSLGVVLYELLSGHRPYRLTQHTPAEIERAICEQDPETPSTAVRRTETDTSSNGTPVLKNPESVSQAREGEPDQLQRRLRGDLDNIVLKALQKSPERRYSSVAKCSEDIQRHLGHLPISARPSTLAYRASKFVQRHSAELFIALAVLLLSTGGTLLAVKRMHVYDDTSRISQYLNGAPPANPNGWTMVGGLTVKSAVPCENLSTLAVPNTTVTLAQSVPAGTFTLSDNSLVQRLPAFCRVEGDIEPTRDSIIHFAVWMPSNAWNRKFRGVGNDGFSGAVNFVDMAAALRRGYATASTDVGHTGSTIDSAWALGHPEKVTDLSYRAIHEMTEKAKVAIRSFYGQAPQFSYFEGLSNGGRQALMEAQRFPGDYDGILAGDAPLNASRLLTAALYNVYAQPPAYIPGSKIPAISSAVLAACDALDGVTDGLINDPRQCHFDPSTLLCSGAESDSCLTQAQVNQMKMMYAGLRDSKGNLLYPGYLPGGEEGDYGWEAWVTGDGPGKGGMPMYALGYFRDIVFENPAWDVRAQTAQRALEMADTKAARLNATDPDLRPFESKGGKLILYHGWSDAGIPGTEAINYYNAVVAKLGLKETESFVRLYMVPGMHHGFLGPGPNFFGQVNLEGLGGRVGAAIPMDPQHNISVALDRWVEKGESPATIIATKYVNDLDPSQGVKMTRPLCPYPKIAKYKGGGDINDAANFMCTTQQANN